MDNFLKKIMNSKMYGIIKAISTSAVVALFLSFVFFTYDVYKDNKQERQRDEQFEKTVQQLDLVRQSLSTRFLGRFPNYITEINNIFSQLQPQDTVIVFEDVLYYGIKSRPEEFYQFNQLLLNHARCGKVIVAYYDNHPHGRMPYWESVFYRMILESRINTNYLSQLSEDRRNQFEAIRDKSYEKKIQVDSFLTETYFMRTQLDDRARAQKDIEKYLIKLEPDSTFSDNDAVVNRLCRELDEIRQRTLGSGKKLEDIHFSDYRQLYSDMTDCLAKFYADNGVELIPLNEYLTMSCWLILPANVNSPTQAILAFPSKYASDEIGFYSQDNSFASYIMAILNGVRRYKSSEKESKI